MNGPFRRIDTLPRTGSAQTSLAPSIRARSTTKHNPPPPPCSFQQAFSKPRSPRVPPPCATYFPTTNEPRVYHMYGYRLLLAAVFPASRYQLLEQVGSGASGTVWKCALSPGQGVGAEDDPVPGKIYAAKIIDLRPFKLRERFSMQR